MRRLLGMRWLACGAALLCAGALPVEALAGCCNVVNGGAESVETIRVCEMSLAGGCDAVLFVGPLAAGEQLNVCSETDLIVHDQPDQSPDGWGSPTGAECTGGDVEL